MTLLPNKHTETKLSLLGLGSLLLGSLERPSTVSGLWERCKTNVEVGSFERFTSTLDFLYLIGAVRLENAVLVRSND